MSPFQFPNWFSKATQREESKLGDIDIEIEKPEIEVTSDPGIRHGQADFEIHTNPEIHDEKLRIKPATEANLLQQQPDTTERRASHTSVPITGYNTGSQLPSIHHSQSQLLVDDEDDIIPPSPKTTLLAHLRNSHGSYYSAPYEPEPYVESFVRFEIPKERINLLNEQRMDVLVLRERCREQRERLSLKRRDTEILHQDILRRLYDWTINPSRMNHGDAQKLLEPSISAHESLRRMELEYQDMEKILNNQEWKLKEEEVEVFSGGVTVDSPEILSPYSNLIVRRKQSDPMSLEEEEIYETKDRSQFERYLFDQLAALQSDAEQIQEQIHELQGERSHLLEHENMMRVLDRPREIKLDEVLAKIDLRFTQLNGELQQLQEKIFDLEDVIADHNELETKTQIFDDDVSSQQLMWFETNNGIDLLNTELRNEDQSAMEVTSTEQPSSPHQISFEPDLNLRSDIIATVSLWLRVMFKISRMEHLVYRNAYALKVTDYPVSNEVLERHALEFWPKDITRRTVRRWSATANQPNAQNRTLLTVKIPSASRSEKVSQISQLAPLPEFGNDSVDAQDRSSERLLSSVEAMISSGPG